MVLLALIILIQMVTGLEDINDPTNGFSNTNFSTVQKDGGGNVTGYIDTGTDKQVDPVSGETIFERSYNYVFNENYELVSGTETENGIQITYGANWEITGRVVSVLTDGELNEGFSVVSSDDLAILPSALKAASGDTYQSSETVPDGSRIETTYYDASGAILGYSSSWSNTEEGSSGRSFEDSDRNWLGDTLNDPEGFYFFICQN